MQLDRFDQLDQLEQLEQLEQLDRLELGILFGALLDSQDTEQRLARISAPVGERCLEAFRAVRHLDPARRRRMVLSLSRRLFSPVPSNIDRIHPSWIGHLLKQESSAVVSAMLPFLPEAVVRRLDLPDPPRPISDLEPQLRQRICRDVLAPLVDMPPAAALPSAEDPGRLDVLRLDVLRLDVLRLDVLRLDVLVSWSEHRILDCMSHLGCMVLARLASLTESSLRDRLLDRLPSPYGPKVQQAMAASLPAVELSDQIPVPQGLEMEQQIQHLGIRLLAPGMSPLSRQQLAQRIPRETGMKLLELEGDAESSPATLQAVALADRWARGGALS